MKVTSMLEAKVNSKIPELAPGDTVKVHAKIVESGKERIQVFNGVVIKIHKCGNGSNFTVRHVAQGIGVERTFPYSSPLVDKVEVLRHGKVRRAKLYYLRDRSGKSARIKERRVDVNKAKAKEEAEALAEVITEELTEDIAVAEAAEAVEAAPEAEVKTEEPVAKAEAEVKAEEAAPEAETEKQD